MCPERARQDLLGISESTESSNTAIGTAVHYGIEQCLLDQMQTGEPMTLRETQEIAVGEWARKEPEIVRWNHKASEAVEIIESSIGVVGMSATAASSEVAPAVRPPSI